MVASGNLALTGVAWLATGVGLRRLLTFYAHRPAAALCARKNLIVSRAADLALLAAGLLLYFSAGGLDYATLFARAADWRLMGLPPEVGAAALLIAMSALLKSAQLPVQGWLVEVMEAPTPVSALLHAGLINGGGFLLLRLSPLLELAPSALGLLAVVGAMTAVFGSLVMLTQTSVKVSLAYSTVAQMGFMMLEIGLGAYTAALLHLVAHSLYKAHAFLSSGSVVEVARAAWSPAPGERPHPAALALAVIAAIALVLTAGLLFGVNVVQSPGVIVLGVVLTLGLTQLMSSSIDAQPSGFVFVRTLAVAGVVAGAYFALQGWSEQLFAGALPFHTVRPGPLQLVLAYFVITTFSALTAFQVAVVGRVDGPSWRALHAHVSNGFYLNTLANRVLLRLQARRVRTPVGAFNGETPA